MIKHWLVGVAAGVAIVGSVSAGEVALPTNTCIVSGDLERARDGVVQTVNYSGALDSWWRSFVEISTSGTFYTNPCMGLLMLCR